MCRIYAHPYVEICAYSNPIKFYTMSFWNFIGGFALFSFICSLFSGSSSNGGNISKHHGHHHAYDDFDDDPYTYFDEYEDPHTYYEGSDDDW